MPLAGVGEDGWLPCPSLSSDLALFSLGVVIGKAAEYEEHDDTVVRLGEEMQ